MQPSTSKNPRKNRLFLSMAICFNINSCIGFEVKIDPFARLHDISHQFNNIHIKFPNGIVFSHYSKCDGGTLFTELSSTAQFNNNHSNTTKFMSDICAGIQDQSSSSTKYTWSPTINGDTNSQDDIVRSQYSTLPYPAVNENDLRKEKSYYTNYRLRSRPYAIYRQIALENINHYLYNGTNEFMLSLIHI